MRLNNWKYETLLLMRYAGSGALNTIVGFICIFSAMAKGFSPSSSNIIGYSVGLVLGFLFSKNFVFRSDGYFVPKGVRYLIAFVFCFLCNFLMLQFTLYFGVNVIVSQFIAAITYTILMYLSSRLFIFNESIEG